jgi:hypothetical protein
MQTQLLRRGLVLEYITTVHVLHESSEEMPLTDAVRKVR